MKGCHEFVGGVEGNGGESRVNFMQAFGVEAGFQSEGGERTVGRFALEHPPPVLFTDGRFIAEHGGVEEFGQNRVAVLRVDGFVRGEKGTFGNIAGPFHPVSVVRGDYCLHGHFIFGQGAGFVRANDGD